MLVHHLAKLAISYFFRNTYLELQIAQASDYSCLYYAAMMCAYVHVCVCHVHNYQCRLKAKGSHKAVIIMSLKRVTSGTWGPSSRVPTSFPPLPPVTVTIYSHPPTICPSLAPWASSACVCSCAHDGGMNRWRPSENGWGMFWMGNLPPFLTEYLGVCPSPVVQEAQRGRARWNENRWWFVV